ncbi:DUF4041 domain-containing protein [Pelagibacterium sp.]|uniref:DUF4041 domain-containing protein n=1 Tax=Pelagibacterium sp. TaxID=1967288 RepID=UPI003BAAAFBE
MFQEIVIATLFAMPFVAGLLALCLWLVYRGRRRISRDLEAERKVLQAERDKRAHLEQRFSVIVDADAEAARIVEAAKVQAEEREREASKTVASLRAQISAFSSNLDELRSSYSEKKAIYDRLAKEVAVFDERLAFAEMGAYEPHFDFQTSDEFKDAIVGVRDRQKQMISGKAAVICTTTWTVDGSVSKGRTMMDRNIRLTLRAFNSECEAAIANTRWNNANAMERRIENAKKQIDKHNVSNSVVITESFFQLKLEELRLTHEYREKQKAEREERAEAARAAREEQRLLKEMEEAEREEARYQRMLDKAKAEAESAVGPKLEAFSQQIELLEHDLAEAHAKVERARAMAEMTRTGYVYIISNIGSFGADIVKIGLTRRLDPADRVRELGDASVPFLFDTHAIIYSEDAPALERALHGEFADRRINAKNMRKEFFRVGLEEVEAAVARLAPGASFFSDIEAQEFHETLAMRKALLSEARSAEALAFPAAL